MSDWISWEEAVAVVGLHFPRERAAGLLHVAIRDGDAVKVWAADEGGVYLEGWPGYQYFDAHSGPLTGAGNQRHYRRINYVDLRSLTLWLKALTSDAEQASAPVSDGPAKARRGGIEKADWEVYRLEFASKVATDGYPDENNVMGWQRQADVARWLAGLVNRDHCDVSPSTLARHAKTLMDQHRPSVNIHGCS